MQDLHRSPEEADQLNTDAALLRAFVVVARTGSFGRAAEQLHVDPSTVSRHVAQLERRIGARLLERTTRQVWLTDAGEALLDRAVAVVEAVDEFRRAAGAVVRQGTREISLGFQTHTLNREVLAWINAAEQAAGVGPIRLVEGTFADPSTGLRDRSVDLALVFAPFDDREIEWEPLVELPWLIFVPASHRLATQPKVQIADLFDEAWVRPDTDDQVFVDFWCANDLRDRPPPIEGPAYATPESALAVIASGRGVGVGASLRDGIQLDGIVARRAADDRWAAVALAWRSDGLTAGAAALRDALLSTRPDVGRLGRVVPPRP
ncbi:LysR family transcriptional regulator [Actinomarinicola tropica]|uniref:LysR family transcriptional regulator n=1 Tax=Actinomarinicola tropica TaxID=2789776 RepID=UPI00189C1B6D|nr:LysR family transcriptional regulator [Actinomarinicola tropica]